MIKLLYNIFIYISIIVLCIILFQADYLKIPRIYSIFPLLFSFFFLFAGFLYHAYSWKKTLEQNSFRVTFSDSVASIGLTIFGKYLPGKIWMIVGRSTYISIKSSKDIKQLTLLSVYAQFIALWTGLLLGFIGLILLGGFYLWGWLTLTLLVVLTTLIFSPYFWKYPLKLYNVILRRDISIPHLSIQKLLLLIPWYSFYWILWSIGFYLMIKSLAIHEFHILMGLGFPLAGTLGIMAIFAPGGLGVREGIMTGYLVLSNFSFQEAATVAVTSRLWFLAGEIFIFLLGLCLHKKKHKK